MGTEIPVKSVRTTFKIVQLLSKQGQMRFSDIARQLDHPMSTVYDHLQSLKTLGYVDETSDGFEISFEFLLLGDRRRSNMQLFHNARTELDDLATTTDEHVSLLVEENGTGRTIYTIQGGNTINFKVFDGTQTHLASTAPGKTVLANLPQSTVEDILDQHGLPIETDTYDDRSDLLADLDSIEEQGYAIDDQEAIRRMRGVGVPIIDKSDEVRGAISIYGPSGRMSEGRLKSELVMQLQEKANIIELNQDLAD